MLRRAAPAALVLLAAAPAAASAQQAPSSMHVRSLDGSRVLASAPFRVRITVLPADAGGTATLTVRRGVRVLARRTVALPGGRGDVVLRSTEPGRVSVTVQHPGIEARKLLVRVLPRAAGPGDSGVAVRWLQRRLARHGYVVGAPGRYDARTARAVLAFRKNAGLQRVTTASKEVFDRLARGEGRFPVRFPSHGRHVEADLSKQLVALIGAGGEVQRIYPTSSGAAATPTVRGSFKVYRKDPGTNALGMIHSAYFFRGYALHGYRDVPVFPASHGCLRLPPADALTVFRWIEMGTRVDVYA